MATTTTHVVAPDHDGLATRLAVDPSSEAGPALAAGQPVTVLGMDRAGSARIELADGTLVWAEAAALEAIGDGAVRAGGGKHHPAPPAPGTDAPVKIGSLRLTTQLVGGALLLLACLLPWTSEFYGGKSAFGVPVRALIDPDMIMTMQFTSGFLKLAFVLFPLGAVVLVSGLRLVPTLVGQVAGGVAALVSLLFVLQLQRQMGNFIAATVFGVLGFGVYLALFGGVISAMSKGDRA